jgi:HSP20 family molecular chaperone IbpA
VGLPQGVSENDISADYHDGVLKVTVKKPETPKPRRIEIGTGGNAPIEGRSKKSN